MYLLTFFMIKLSTCVHRLTEWHHASQGIGWALVDFPFFLQPSPLIYQLLQSKLASCSAVSATEVIYLPGQQVWLCPLSAGHWIESSSPFSVSLLWQHLVRCLSDVFYHTSVQKCSSHFLPSWRHQLDGNLGFSVHQCNKQVTSDVYPLF